MKNNIDHTINDSPADGRSPEIQFWKFTVRMNNRRRNHFVRVDKRNARSKQHAREIVLSMPNVVEITHTISGTR
jgi:hypothetical protein